MNSHFKKLIDLDQIDRKNILNKLIGGMSPEMLSDEYMVNIPNVVTAIYSCPQCQRDFPIKLVTQDISNSSRFVRCPNCHTKSFVSTLQVSNNLVSRKKRIGLGDFISLME